MTSTEPATFRLPPSAPQGLDELSGFLRAHAGQPVTILAEGERPLDTLAVQLLLAAQADPAGPAPICLVGSDPVLDGLRRLGLGDRFPGAF